MRSDCTAREGPDPISDPDHLEPGMGGSTHFNIETFEPTTDMLVCIRDDSIIGAPAPQVRLETDPDHNGWLRIRLGADIVAKVHGRTALSSADLAVIPLSSALALGLAPPDGAFLQ